jgi:hypothetical protein
VTPEQRRARFDALADETDSLRRRLAAVALLGDRLGGAEIVPIVVGGTALEFYTAGGYATKDVDLALPTSPEVDAAFAELGFVKEGRYWVREDLDLLFEAPAPEGLPGEEAPRTRIEIADLPVEIVGVEDLLLDRLRALVHWQSEEDGRWARRLAGLYSDRIDWSYLRGRVRTNAEESTALEAIARELSAT